ncbi:MAG: hypothetical protein CBC73_04930 [Flavobacteriales bacterium TMED113]|nr:MAG: hypothetical protein CBC73_04930 [Flavobacteriales bacterium TMED113]
MKYLYIFFFLFSSIVLSQNFYTISGYIEDAATGESLIGVNVYSKSLSVGTTTNNFGFYSLTVPEGEFDINFSFIGYSDFTKILLIKTDLELNTRLVLSSNIIKEVILTDQVSNVQQTQTSVISVPVIQIKSMPALLGEIDVLKSIQLLPGVQSGSEGSSGFYVRGGGPDQNLILLDGVPVYNASHLFGFFSVFNIDAIKNVKLTKGGFPARFGGRLSSVLEIDMKEGNMKEFKGEGSIGLISSKLALEGPIVKDKASFMISARRTYADLLLNLFQPSPDATGGYYFYDLNAKLNYKISNRDRVYLSGYFGDDIFGLNFNESGDDEFIFGLGWGNKTTAFRWNHVFNNKLFSNTTLTYSRYSFDIDQGFSSSDSNFEFSYISGLRDFGAKIDFEYSLNPKHSFKFGYSHTYHDFFPGELSLDFNYDETDIDTVFQFSDDLQAHDLFLYVEDEIKFNERLKMNLGTHLALFSIKDSAYLKLQPRFSARYLINEKWSLKASYAEMQQNLHLLTNSSVGLPTDIWVPATDSVKPQQSKQFALSINTNFLDGILEASVEGYYKKMDDLVSYKEGSSFWDAQSWESSVETGGEGKSYGLELFLQKKKGKTTGWIGYTLSWTYRRFNNINFGDWYSYKYDRRHDISIVLSHKFSDKIDIGATWVYGTGNAITFPQATYWSYPSGPQGQYIQTLDYYGERNSTRMNPYHRFDLGVNFHKQKKSYERTISLSIYNLYNRKNPFFVYLDEEPNQTVARQVSLFPIIPTLTYNIRF